jgi:amidase
MAAIDSIGGVRIPAAFCGIFGYRASHGVISTVGTIPVAPSLDVVGGHLNFLNFFYAFSF